MGKIKFSVIALLCLVFVFGILPLTAALPAKLLAASGITLDSSVEVTFPTMINFKVKAQSDADITRLRLHYKIDNQNYADVVSEGWAQFSPAKTVETQWLWDMRRGGLPPGSEFEYWWTALDAEGKTAQTDRFRLSFDDDTHTWKSIYADPVTLYWYSGDEAFAQTLMDAAQQGLYRLETDTGAIHQGQVKIYIYQSAQDLRASQLFAPEWEGGVTYIGYDIIAIGVSPMQVAYGERTVPHELTHWLVDQITFNHYGAGLPVWLEEGLATYAEGSVSTDNQYWLSYAVDNTELISVRSLSSPFSAVPKQAYISYAESNSIVTFLIHTYGKEKMSQLLEVFHEGSLYDDALLQVYGFDQDGLEILWQQSLEINTVIPEETNIIAGFAPVPAYLAAVEMLNS